MFRAWFRFVQVENDVCSTKRVFCFGAQRSFARAQIDVATLSVFRGYITSNDLNGMREVQDKTRDVKRTARLLLDNPPP